MTLPFWRLSQGIADYWGSLAVSALLIMLVVSGFGTLKNAEYHAQESAHFRVGADIRLILDSNASETLPDEIRKVSAVRDVTLVTRGLWNTRTREVRALVVSPDSFVRTIHQFKAAYLGLSQFEDHLRALQGSGYVLIDREASSTLDWTKGTNYTFGLTSEPGGPTISLHCEAQFDRFPSFVLEEDRGASSDESVISMVMDASTWTMIMNQSSSVSTYAQELLIKLKEPSQSNEVLERLIQEFGVEGESWEDFVQAQHSPGSFILPQIFMVFVLISLACSISVFSTDALAIRYKRREQLEFMDLLGIDEKTEKLLALTEFGVEILLSAILFAAPIYLLAELNPALLTVREDVLPFLPVF